jgi:transitional endoplasmic reticulum ATPase
LLLACGLWANAAHYEVWVFNQGNWQKDGALWDSIQKADWKDIILKETFKKSFQKDVFGFYDSERLYKELGIPWKRGLIMYGPPGNGKTITLKAVMKTCDAKGYTPLYVKSFQSFAGDEYSMRVVFSKARQSAPCVLILEDLDSLITDRNRSFFLNELDGLETNDGILVLATTNHFDRLDPGLSSRPSRFDRKYLFDDPDQEERTLYAVYWQKKLKNNHSIEFPDTLVDEIAEATEQFSFAYLKEAFVSALVILAGLDENEDKPSFRTVLMEQIDVLRKQLDKPEAVIPAVSIEEGKAQDLPSLPVVVPPISRPLPHPGRRFYTENIRRQTTSGNGASQVIVPPSPPLLPIGPFDPRSAEAQHQLNSDMMALRARLSALRVPGGFGNPEEDEFAIPSLHIPSPQSQSVNRSLPGMSGYWA